MPVKTINVDKEVHKEIEKLRRLNKRSYSAQVSFMLQEKIKQDHNTKKVSKKVISSERRKNND